MEKSLPESDGVCDGLGDVSDNCPEAPDPLRSGLDADNDGIGTDTGGDYSALDDYSDNVSDEGDCCCPTVPQQLDTHSDVVESVCDNCVSAVNASQLDCYSDGVDDECDRVTD